ncbi:DNA-binding transcriptional LysR family regulator [Haloferula luteola]|uniref:DNA-binding transcriptional LysR family regulator n=1 Tax=Haloferula luteola TaxID=595692 RepID=A0A840V4L3_9BACT|nr:LysR family transcriptional regulator [Haloferula luteola]MBB5352922.1 DNA-binding transcriptional LysR family regulator [Haloferula luteola]
MDLEGLSTFVLLAEHGSGAQVAKLQGLSQAAVSQRISRVEAAYGIRLFIRLGEGMVLTDEGTLLLPEAKRILREVVNLGVSVTRGIRNERKRTKIVIDRSMRGDRMARHLRNLEAFEVMRVMPHTRWENSLLAGEVDLALQASCGQALEIEGLCRFELRLEPGATLAWNPESFPLPPTVGLANLLREALIIPSDKLIPGFDRFFDLVGARSLVPCDLVTIGVDSENDAREACLHGVGVLFFPGNAMKRLRLGSARLESRVAMEFAMPRAYALSLYVKSAEDRPWVLQVVRDFVNRGARAAGKARSVDDSFH